MAVVVALSALAAAGLCSVLGGDPKSQLLAAAAVAAGSIPTFLPVLLGGHTRSGASNFGLLVLFASGARSLLILAIALAFSQTRTITPRPFWLGAMAGAGIILLAESTLSVILLARCERLKAAGSNPQTRFSTQTIAPAAR